MALLVVGALGVAAADDRRYLADRSDDVTGGAPSVYRLPPMPRFEEAITGTLDVLQRRGRVSYAAITRQYGLSADDLEALKDELIEILGAARDEAASCSSPSEAAPGAEGAPSGRLVSVMACDLVALDAAQPSASIPSSCATSSAPTRRSVEAAIERHGGHAARWQGDGVMVYFGYPRAEEDDAVRAVRCGWEILRDLAGGARARRAPLRRHAPGARRRALRHGRRRRRRRDGLAGLRRDARTSPRASRASPRPTTSPSRRRSARSSAGHFDLEPLGPHELKGVEEPIELFRVSAPRRNVARFEAERAARLVPLVDRETERARARRGRRPRPLGQRAPRSCSPASRGSASRG